MSNPSLPAATTELIRAVLALVDTARGDPDYRVRTNAALDQCKVALNATKAALNEGREAAAPLVAPKTAPGDLGLRVAELRAYGYGVRAIARQLGVNASTVSRRLRRAHLVAK